MKKDRGQRSDDPKVAPGVDPDDSYGENATQSDVNKGEYTTVTRLVYDEYDHSEK